MIAMHNPYFIPSGTIEEFNVIIEIPKHSQNKYELDKKTGLLWLDRVNYSSDMYPVDYGFIPSTKAGDGDAVDVLVLLSNPVPPLTVIPCRAIGMLPMIDSGEEDVKILAVPTNDKRFMDTQGLSDVAEHVLVEIDDFMRNYKRLQHKIITTEQWQDKAAANEYISKHLNNYTQPE
jgi:inorganic pyrophosphatase